ncbi:MAG: hypothetical protein KDA75_13530 [Planctomycetaceae bacterium]|nr:hypothetical protein [Planctomycetaceae bacterium]
MRKEARMKAVKQQPQAVDHAAERFFQVRHEVNSQWGAERYWERILTHNDRLRLGGNLPDAYRRLRTVGMWTALHGGSFERATLELARSLGAINEMDYGWLLRELGEASDDEVAAIEHAKKQFDLVLVEEPRTVYYQGELIDINWHRFNALWDYFVVLLQAARDRRSIDITRFAKPLARGYLTGIKSRLTLNPNFPVTLGDLILPGGKGRQRLDIPPERICVFEVETREVLARL